MLTSLANGLIIRVMMSGDFARSVLAIMPKGRAFVIDTRNVARTFARRLLRRIATIYQARRWRSLTTNVIKLSTELQVLYKWVRRKLLIDRLERGKLLVELASMWLGLLLLEILQPAIGTRTQLVAATMAVMSSETPTGEWRHVQSVHSVEAESSLLSHSQIYSDADVIRQVTAWLAEGAQEKHCVAVS